MPQGRTELTLAERLRARGLRPELSVMTVILPPEEGRVLSNFVSLFLLYLPEGQLLWVKDLAERLLPLFEARSRLDRASMRPGPEDPARHFLTFVFSLKEDMEPFSWQRLKERAEAQRETREKPENSPELDFDVRQARLAGGAGLSRERVAFLFAPIEASLRRDFGNPSRGRVVCLAAALWSTVGDSSVPVALKGLYASPEFPETGWLALGEVVGKACAQVVYASPRLYVTRPLRATERALRARLTDWLGKAPRLSLPATPQLHPLRGVRPHYFGWEAEDTPEGYVPSFARASWEESIAEFPRDRVINGIAWLAASGLRLSTYVPLEELLPEIARRDFENATEVTRAWLAEVSVEGEESVIDPASAFLSCAGHGATVTHPLALAAALRPCLARVYSEVPVRLVLPLMLRATVDLSHADDLRISAIETAELSLDGVRGAPTGASFALALFPFECRNLSAASRKLGRLLEAAYSGAAGEDEEEPEGAPQTALAA